MIVAATTEAGVGPGLRRDDGVGIHRLGIGRRLLMAFLVLIAAAMPAYAEGGDEARILVPRITIYPGDTVSDAALAERTARLAPGRPVSVHTDRAALSGLIARRTLLPGQPIPLDAVRRPHAVTQGQPALMVYQDGGLVITGQGVPLQSAGTGEAVSVRNIETGSIVRGRVMPDRSIAVDGR